MSKYELSLSPEYAAEWTLTDAIRELFQNALDQQTTQSDNTMFCRYEYENRLSIGNKNSVLEAKSLLLGATTKAKDADTIGQFGEGYKIATLVLLRLGKDVKFFNYGKKEVWIPRFVKSRKYGATILVVDTESFVWKKPPDNDLTIVVKGITPDEYKEIVETNLHLQTVSETLGTKLGNILLSPRHKGQIYVNGLFIKTVEKFVHGYDIKPKYLKIGRDRNLVDSFDIAWVTSQMWRERQSSEIIKLVQDGAYDVSYITSISAWEPALNVDLTVQLQEAFTTTYGSSAIPVSNQTEADAVITKYTDAKPIIVADLHKNLMVNGSVPFKPTEVTERKQAIVMTPYDKLEKWYKKAHYNLSEKLKKQFQEIMKELAKAEKRKIEEEEVF